MHLLFAQCLSLPLEGVEGVVLQLLIVADALQLSQFEDRQLNKRVLHSIGS